MSASSESSFVPIGFAIRRNGSCLAIEVACGPTFSPFNGCCPSSTVCPQKYNIDCCPPGVDCTPALLEAPRCANASWTMYDNGGYFCCEPGTLGYNATLTNSNGCMLPGVPPKNVKLLAVVSQAVFSSSTSSRSVSTSTTATGTATASPSTTTTPPSISNPASSSSSSLSKGAIIGLSIGIVLAVLLLLLAVLLYRRRRHKALLSKSEQATIPAGTLPNGQRWGAYAHELPQQGDTRHELVGQTMGASNQKPGERAELPTPVVTEMPAMTPVDRKMRW